jgi:hypothetical protein
MNETNRRDFVKKAGAVLATGVLASVGTIASASEQKHKQDMSGTGILKSQKGVDAFVVSADEEKICATCQYWGGGTKSN